MRLHFFNAAVIANSKMDYLSVDVIINKFVLLLAGLDAFIAISEDLNLKFSRESIPPDPSSLLMLTHLH